MSRDQYNMPDVPIPDFLGAICEIWFTINYAAYHLAYTRVYLQTRSMQTHVDELWGDEQSAKDMGQVDLIICRSHLAAFFWQLHHMFEALEVAIRRGKNEYPEERYFYSHERQLERIRESPIPKEIEAYRNEGHYIPAIIGQQWEEESGKFSHHFFPSIQDYQPKDSVELNHQLQIYFEYAVNLWLSFVPEPYKSRFPRSFSFPVTVPFFYLGNLPPELRDVRQLQVCLEAYEKPGSPDFLADTQPQRSAPED